MRAAISCGAYVFHRRLSAARRLPPHGAGVQRPQACQSSDEARFPRRVWTCELTVRTENREKVRSEKFHGVKVHSEKVRSERREPSV